MPGRAFCSWMTMGTHVPARREVDGRRDVAAEPDDDLGL
jgi:hypothetical protein